MKHQRTLLAAMTTSLLALGLGGCSDDNDSVTPPAPEPDAPLEVSFEKTTRIPSDGSWDTLFSDNNNLDYEKYAVETPEMKPWTNGQYALSAAEWQDEIWYGTAAGAWCYWPTISMKQPMSLGNWETPRQACQLTPKSGQMPDAQLYTYNASTGKTTHIGRETVTNGGLYWKDMMEFHYPKYDDSGAQVDEGRYSFTMRGAGAIDDLVFMAGSTSLPIRDVGHYLDALPADKRAIELKKFPEGYDFDQEGKIGYNRLFVFDAKKKEYLGYADFYYDTIRLEFKTVTQPDGTLAMYWFGGTDQSGGQAGNSATQMLRWVGTEESPLSGGTFHNGFDLVSDDAFGQYGTIGDFNIYTDDEGNQRFVAASWYNPQGEPASMLFTNAMPEGGFTPEQPAHFNPFFKYTDYDPDPVGAKGAKFAANAVFGDYLYFGSYHQGTSGAYDKLMHKYCDEMGIEKICKLKDYAFEDIDAHREFMMKSWRALSFYRIKLKDIIAGDPTKVELLYGKEKDWVLVPMVDDNGDALNDYRFELMPNNMGQKPKWGDEGFGHQGLVYTFTMAVHDNKLFLGTWNATAGLFDMFENLNYNKDSHAKFLLTDDMIVPVPNGKMKMTENNPAYFLYQSIIDDSGSNGYDLDQARSGWTVVFEDTKSPGTLVNQTGFDNPCNNGVRNFAKIDGELYLGTTSWCNLSSDAGMEFYRYAGSNR